MAAIDFPAAPAVNQIFAAPNGVNYQWTGALWVVVGGRVEASPGGDFSASGVNDQNIGSGGQVIAFATVKTGNAGSHFSTSTNRYTPPAGRYSLIASGYLWNSTGSTGSYQLTIRKNGVIVGEQTATCVAGTAIPATVAVTVDANGTDYFDVWGYGAAGTPRIYTPFFEAFPLSGIKGPPGDPHAYNGGDFCAVGGNVGTLSAAFATMIPPTIMTGNGGGWYSTSTGRWTPPAGRYFIYGTVTGYHSVAVHLAVKLRKNGVDLQNSWGTTGAANWFHDPAVGLIVDANGTDWFDMQAQSQSVTGSIQSMTFLAYPISGVKGPPGDRFDGTVGGDFFATLGAQSVGTGPTVLIFPTISLGNAGSWYNPVNGRYAPPAGRYILVAGFGYHSSASLIIGEMGFRKNGSVLVGGRLQNTPAAANNSASVTNTVIVDANGTDYFEVTASTHVPNSSGYGFFGAFPISGVKGPPGDQGPPGELGFRLLQRTALSAAQADVSIQNIPADINEIKFTFDITPSINDSDLVFQFYDAVGALVNQVNQYGSVITQAINSQSAGSAPYVYNNVGTTITNGVPLNVSVASARVSATTGIRGGGEVVNIRAARWKGLNFHSNYVDSTGSALRVCTGGGWRGGASGAITGFRLVFGGGNIAAGSVLSVWGSA